MDMSTEIGDGVIMDYFVSMLLIGIGVALLATGLFTSYFGAGKSQKIGLGLLVTGILAIIITYILTFEAGTGVTTQFDDGVFMDALVSGISALAGMIIGMFVILFVLMKVDTVDDLEDLETGFFLADFFLIEDFFLELVIFFLTVFFFFFAIILF